MMSVASSAGPFSATIPPGTKRWPVRDLSRLSIVYYKINGIVAVKRIFTLQDCLDEG